MPQQNIPEELQQLRKRARRRLIGALALVVFSLCVLWTALDSQPPASMQTNQQVEVISSAPVLTPPAVQSSAAQASTPELADASMPDQAAQDGGVPLPEVTPASMASDALRGRLINVQQPEASTTPVPKPAATPKPKPSPRPTPKPTVKPTTDPQRILDGLDDPSGQPPRSDAPKTKYLIQVGAYADAEKAAQIIAKMKAAGLPVVSDKVETREKGTLTRVRLGPTANESLAKDWVAKLHALGLDGHVVTK